MQTEGDAVKGLEGDEVDTAEDEGEDEGEDDNDEEDDNDDNEDDKEDDNEGGGGDGACTNWINGDSNGGDAPELLFSISGERKIPPCTMNATEDGAKDKQKQEVG